MQEYLYNALPLFFHFENAVSGKTAVTYTTDSAIDDVMKRGNFMILGAQLYTLRDYLKTEKDIKETMKKVADIGYTTVQASGVGPVDPRFFKSVCDENGLRIIVTHTHPDRVLGDTENVIKDHDVYDCKYIGIGSMPDKYRTEEGFYEFVRDFTPAIDKISASGKKFMYHHHSFEFYRMKDGRTLLEHLLETFSPERMSIICDTYWLQFAGCDVCSTIASLKGRLECVHLKDMCIPNVENRQTFAPVGEGNMNFPLILDAFEKAGTEYMFVEQDECAGSPFDALKTSFENVRKMGY